MSKETIKGFLKDKKGHYSMTRLTTFLLVATGIILAFTSDPNEALILGMISLGVTGKLVQKHIESSFE